MLGDRTQAPSGAGFALENRVATPRALSDIQSAMNVHRLAGFFRDLRDALFDLADAPEEVAILTPGQHNETYFEHAYIARYLGFMLLEGEDLTVADGKVMVRTVEGPRPLSVLWRRLDAAFMDPLELRHDSRIGTPGLVDAVRRGGTTMVNALGSGILETRALLAFLPGVCRHLDGDELQAAQHRHLVVRTGERARPCAANLDRMMIGPRPGDPAAGRRQRRHGARCDRSPGRSARRWSIASAPPAVTTWRRNRSPCRPCPSTPRAGSSRGR